MRKNELFLLKICKKSPSAGSSAPRPPIASSGIEKFWLRHYLYIQWHFAGY